MEKWPVPGCRLRGAPGAGGGAAAAGGGTAGEGSCGDGGGWLPPLVVSGPRGLAAAFTGGLRSLMIDLEEDEEGAEGESEEEVEGEEVDGVGAGGEEEAEGKAGERVRGREAPGDVDGMEEDE